MVELGRNELTKIKGGNVISDIIGSAFKGIESIFGVFEHSIFSGFAISKPHDKLLIDVKNSKIDIDDSATNKANKEIELQKLKQFGTPAPMAITLM